MCECNFPPRIKVVVYIMGYTNSNYYVIILQKRRQKSYSTNLMILKMEISHLIFQFPLLHSSQSSFKNVSGYVNIIETLFLTSL